MPLYSHLATFSFNINKAKNMKGFFGCKYTTFAQISVIASTLSYKFPYIFLPINLHMNHTTLFYVYSI